MKLESSLSKSSGIQLISLNQCPVCQGTSRRQIFNITDSPVYDCNSCGLRYLDPCLSPLAMQSAYESNETLSNLHSFHEGYYDYGDLSIKSKTFSDFEKALKLLEEHLSGSVKPYTIFDVGFGNGFFLALAKQRGWAVNGSDSSSKNAELASKKFSLELLCTDFKKYESSGKLFDVVSFWDVIEHLPNPHEFIKKASLMLKPNGLILIGLPNDKSMLRFISSFLYRATFGRFRKGIESTYFLEHAAYYNLKTLQNLLNQNKFVLCNHFLTSTDLEKYSFSRMDKLIAGTILFLGKITGYENRLVAVFQRERAH